MKSKHFLFFIFSIIFIFNFNLQAEDLVKVKIGYSRLRISLPLFVAYEKEFFKKNGIDAELEMFDTAQPLMDALCSGKLKAAGYTALPITFNAQLRSRKSLYYSTILFEDDNHPISMLVVKKNSDIKSISDLKGKRIGILPTFAYKVWLELILEKNDISVDDVIIQQVSPAMTPSALDSGTVDAMLTNDPAVTTCVQKNIGRILVPGAVVADYLGSPFPFASFNMAKKFADDNPETANKIIRSLDEAIDFINVNQQEAKKIMALFLPEAQKPFVEYYPDALFCKSDKVLIKDLINIEKSYRKLGITKQKLNLSNLLYR